MNREMLQKPSAPMKALKTNMIPQVNVRFMAIVTPYLDERSLVKQVITRGVEPALRHGLPDYG